MTPHDDDYENEEEEIVYLIEEQQLDNFPLKGKDIKEAKEQDPMFTQDNVLAK